MLPEPLETDYRTLALKADQLARAGDPSGAIAMLQQLINNAALPAADRAMMILNKAKLFEKMGETENALGSYERAIAMDVTGMTVFFREHQAAYLGELGRLKESLAAYKSMLDVPELKTDDRQRISANITLIEQALRK